MTAPLRITIIRTTSLGDVILATAVVDFLSRLPLDVTITWLGRPPTLAALAASFPALRLVPLTKAMSWWQLYTELRREDVIIDLQQSIKTRAVCLAIQLGGKATVAFSDKLYRQRHRLLRAAKAQPRDALLPASALKPPVRQYQVAVATCHDALIAALAAKGQPLPAPLAQALAAAKDQARPRLNLPAATVAETAAKIRALYPSFRPDQRSDQRSDQHLGQRLRQQVGQPVIAVAPGASYAPKRAPVATFAAILASARRRTPFAVLLLGDSGDSQVCKELSAKLAQDSGQGPNGSQLPVFDVSGQLSFVESVAALSLCRGILGNDSVLPHCSEALGQPSFTLFGPTIEGFGFAPFRQDSAALSVNLGCRPCSKHGQNPCRFGDRACFTRLPVARIAEQLSSIVSAP